MSIIRGNRIKFIVFGILAVFVFLVWSAYFSAAASDSLKVTFFDVGQGDSFLIETPNQGKIIIDGGPDNSVLAKIGRVLSFYDRAVDILIITHPDSDHLAGAVEIAKNYEVGLIIINGKDCVTALCGEFEKIVKQKNIKVISARAGQKIDFGNSLQMDILMPKTSVSGVEKKTDDNNSSIISLLSFGKDSFLFTGDAEAREEIDLINAYPRLTAEVLKVGHHGSKNSSNELFLDRIKPKFSVISVGAKNTYGHPTIEVLERIKNIGSEILRTDLGGDVVMESEGRGILIK